MNRIDIAIEFLKDGKSFKVDDLLFQNDQKGNLIVNGWSNYSYLENLTKSIAIEELYNLKSIFENMLASSVTLEQYINNRHVIYVLNFDSYGKASVEICKELNGQIIWSHNLE